MMKGHKQKLYFGISFVILTTTLLWITNNPKPSNMVKYINVKTEAVISNNTDISNQEQRITNREPGSEVVQNKDSEKNYVRRTSLLEKRPLNKLRRPKHRVNTNSTRAGSGFTVQGKDYGVVENLYAIRARKGEPEPDNVVESKNGYYLVELASEEEAPEDALVVVKKSGNSNLVIFTGQIRVKLYDYQADAVTLIDQLNDHLAPSEPNISAKIANEFEHISIISYQFDSYQDTLTAARILSSSAMSHKVKRSTIDLLEWQRVSN